jgi:prophage antirepressor-like protein
MPVRDQMIQELALPYFSYKDRSVRWKIINEELWFIINDIYNALHLNKGKELRELEEDEKIFITIFTKTGDRNYKAVNKKGLSHIFNKSKNDEVKNFVSWISETVSPLIWQTGTYIQKKEEKILYLLDN